MHSPRVCIIGGGLAGVEAANVLAKAGIPVDLYEMRPVATTPAHKTDLLAELVCSNSFKGTDELTAHGILKREMEELGSIVLEIAGQTRVPAGKALAVDRMAFARMITERISSHPLVAVHRKEVTSIQGENPTIIATGPLTSDALARQLMTLTGSGSLFFYDAISPIVDADSVDMDHSFEASRWSDGKGDYLNCPMDRTGYERFVEEILHADQARKHEFEDARFFESCLPIEVMASRGMDALRYGPMRPVGLIDPKTLTRPYAVVQLRKENLKGGAYTLVGFQTRLTYPEQKRVLAMIPALKGARFLRYGSIHRNTFLDSPRILDTDLSLRACRSVYLAGQITGVEGYMESSAMGILAGMSVLARIRYSSFSPPGAETAMGSLVGYITDRGVKTFQPMNANFGIMTMPDVPKKARNEARSQIARRAFTLWKESFGTL